MNQREEFIARLKRDLWPRNVHMNVFVSPYNTNTIEAALSGEYRRLGWITFYPRGAAMCSPKQATIWQEAEYNIANYNKLISEIFTQKAKYDVPYVKIQNTLKLAYKTHFPNLAAELPFKALPICQTETQKMRAGNIDHVELQDIVHLEAMATRRKLLLALGDTPLPIPIRQAIIDG